MTNKEPPNVVLHADDLGLTLGFNEGILVCATKGLLTSTCVRVNGAAYHDAVNRIIPQIPHVSIGLHLNIVEGRSTRQVIGQNEILCRPDGSYRQGFVSLLINSFKPTFLAEVEADFRDQIERALKDLGSIDHLNSHQHSHAIPAIFTLTCRLAVEYGIPVVRMPNEPLYLAGPFWRHLRSWFARNLVKWSVLKLMAIVNERIAARWGVHTPNRFVGILYTGFMTVETVMVGIQRAARPGRLIEVLLHPAYILGHRDETFLDAEVRDYVYDPARRYEISVLTSPKLRDGIHDAGSRITNLRGTAVPVPSMIGAAAHDGRRLRTIVILDETPFYQPSYFQRLMRDCTDIEVVAVAIVVLPKGGKLQSYLTRKWRELGPFQLFRLGLKSIFLRTLDRLPRFIRGDFTGSILRLARESHLPYRVINKVNTYDFRNWVSAHSPDLIISSNSCSFGSELINIPRVACINRHSALLPSYGGILPVFRSVQFGKSYTGASIHYMTEGLDKGGVLSRKFVPIFPGDSLDRLYRLCFLASYDATVEAVSRLRSDRNSLPISDDGIRHSYFSFPESADWAMFRQRRIPFI